MTVRVVIADDQTLVRAGFRMILDARDDIEVVGEAEDGGAAVTLVADVVPDVVLMDVRMPGVDGIEATRRIVAAGSAARIIMLTTYDLDEYVFAALRAGASGFMLKDVRPAELVEGIRVVARGDALLAPSVTRRLLDRLAGTLPDPAEAPPDVGQLTEREVEVLQLVGSAFSNAEIAARLYLSEATVKTHVSAVLRKLGLRDRVQAVVYAYDVERYAERHRDRRSEQALRLRERCHRPVVHRLQRPGRRLPRTERRRQEHHVADAARADQPEPRHGDVRRSSLRRARPTEHPRRCGARTSQLPSGSDRAQPPPRPGRSRRPSR
jgi:DNA-binding NarL/FixJ family response regulator